MSESDQARPSESGEKVPYRQAVVAARDEARRGLGNGPEWLPQFAGEVLTNVLRSLNEALGDPVCGHGFQSGHLVYKRNEARLRDWCEGPTENEVGERG